MKTSSVVLGALALLGIGGVAMAASKSKEEQDRGAQLFVFTYYTSRPINNADLIAIEQSLSSPQGIPGMIIQGIAQTGPQEFKVNASLPVGTNPPPEGSVGVIGSNPSDAITVQLTKVERV